MPYSERPGHDGEHDEFGSAPFERESATLDIVGALRRHGRTMAGVTVVIGLVTFAGIAGARLLPPVERICSLDIAPTFRGATEGKYPNGTRFSPQDIIASNVVEPVWHDQGLEKAITLTELMRNLEVTAGGTELELLRSDYQQRFLNTKLTTAERTALEAEFGAKLRSMMSASVNVSLASAGRLASEQMERLLLALPAEWARASDAAGARTYDFPLPLGSELRSAGAKLPKEASPTSIVVHAERVDAFVNNLSSAVAGMAKITGSEGIKDSTGATLIDLASELAAIRRNVIVPTYVNALRLAKEVDLAGYQPLRSARLQLLEAELQAAKERARVLREALEGYSDVARGARRPDVVGADEQRQPGLTAQVDGSFIDRVIEQAIKGRDIDYRRTLADRRLEADLEVVKLAAKSEFENWLDKEAQDSPGPAVVLGAGAEPILAVTETVARLGDRAWEIFRALSARNLYSTSAMYRVETPPEVRVVPAVSSRTVMVAGVASWFMAMAVVLIRGAVADRRARPAFARIDLRTTEEYRRQSAASLPEKASPRNLPHRLPDESRQPVG